MNGLLERLPMDPAWTEALLQLWEPKLLAGVAGLLLLVLGARVYRLAIIAPGFAAGAIGASMITVGASGQVQLAAALVLGLLGAVLLYAVEQLAIALAGALSFGGLAHALAPLVLGAAAPWYLPPLAALVGFVLVPRVYLRFLPLITSVLGALAVAWSIERPRDLGLIGGLALAGLVVQLLIRRRPRRSES